MFWSWSNSKIIGTPEKETIECVLKSHRDYKYMYDYEKKFLKLIRIFILKKLMMVNIYPFYQY